MFDTSFYINEVIPALNKGLLVSLSLIFPSAICGLIIGIIIGTLRAMGKGIFSKIAAGYATIFRGTPLVVQLFILYFGLPNIGIYLSPYLAATLGFTLCSGAYHSEYIRGALLSIKKGQILAAQALGFSQWSSLVNIILPQAIRRALPGCGNEIIYLIKYSSLAYLITCIELTGEGKIIATKTFRFTEVFLAVGFYYLIMVTLAGWFLKWIEKKLYVPGFGNNR